MSVANSDLSVYPTQTFKIKVPSIESLLSIVSSTYYELQTHQIVKPLLDERHYELPFLPTIFFLKLSLECFQNYLIDDHPPTR